MNTIIIIILKKAKKHKNLINKNSEVAGGKGVVCGAEWIIIQMPVAPQAQTLFCAATEVTIA